MGLKRLHFLVLPIGIVLIVTNLRAILDFWRAGERITVGSERVERLRRENDSLKRQIEKTQTEQYLEEAARNKLGWVKPGEEIVIIPESLLKTEPVSTSGAVPNWERWKNLFF